MSPIGEMFGKAADVAVKLPNALAHAAIWVLAIGALVGAIAGALATWFVMA